MRASYHSYYSGNKKELDEKVSLSTLLDDIENDTGDKTNVNNFMQEFLRQATQLKRQGDISENLYATIRKALWVFQDWLRESLATVREKLPGAYKGDFGPEIQQMLLEINAKANELSRKESLPSKIENVIKAESDQTY